MVIEIEEFLSDENCDKLIEIAESKLGSVGVLGDEIEGYRVAKGCWLEDTDGYEIINHRERVSLISNLPVSNMELIHIVRYGINEEYKEHHDFFHPEEKYYTDEMDRGGQRLKSSLVYLNDDFSGGETEFPNLNFTVKPKKGKLVLWDNINDDGSLDYDSLHAGLPVISGYKYIAVIWIREGIFS
jgi:prolyl 4-hydroxylase